MPLIVASTASFGPILIGLLIGGLGLGLLPPTLNVWITSVAPPTVRGRAVGGLTTALFLGQFLTPIFTQPLVNQTSLANMFGFVGGLAIALAIIFAGLAMRQS